MRKLLLFFTIILVAAAVLYQFLSRHQGFVLISLGHYVVETSLWAVVLFSTGFFLLFTVLRKLYRMLALPGYWLSWRAGRRQQRFRATTLQGIVDYMEGNWPRAIANFNRSVGQPDMPAINYLGAAAASFQLGDFKAAQSFLDEAETVQSADPFTAGLLRARLFLQQANLDKAQSLVEKLHRQNPQHPTVLRMLASARKGVRDWRGVESLLRDIKKYKALTASELQQLEEEVYSEIIAAFPSAGQKNASLAELQQQLDRLWGELPRHLQKNTQLVIQYVQKLQLVDRGEKAESRLRRYLGKHWNDQLVEVYGAIAGNSTKQLAAAEAWLIEHKDNAILFRALARICVRAELWGKAKFYFEQSLLCAKDAQTYYDLAELLTALNEPAASARCYREGLKSVVTTG